MVDVSKEEANAREFVGIMSELGSEIEFVRIGNPDQKEPDAIVKFQGQEHGVELTYLMDDPASESGKSEAIRKVIGQLIREIVGIRWRGMLWVYLKDSLSTMESARALVTRVVQGIAPFLDSQTRIEVDVDGARVVGEPHAHFAEVCPGIHDPSLAPTPKGLEDGLIRAFERKAKKQYVTKNNWLLIVDRSDFPHDQGIDKERVVHEAKSQLASKFDRVYLLGKWSSRAALQRIM